MFFDIFILQQHGMSLLFMNLFVSLLLFFISPIRRICGGCEKIFSMIFFSFHVFNNFQNYNFFSSVDTSKFRWNLILSQFLNKWVPNRIWMSLKSIRSRTFVWTLCKMITILLFEQHEDKIISITKEPSEKDVRQKYSTHLIASQYIFTNEKKICDITRTEKKREKQKISMMMRVEAKRKEHLRKFISQFQFCFILILRCYQRMIYAIWGQVCHF